MRHSKTFQEAKKSLKLKERRIKEDIDLNSQKFQRIVLMALAGGIILSIISGVFSKSKKKRKTERTAPIEMKKKSSLLKWFLGRVLEVGLYYLLSQRSGKR